MAFYTVLTPPPEPGKSAADLTEDAVFLKDGFILFAFIFTGLWLLSKRLWLAFFVFLVLWAAIGFGGRAIGLHPLGLGLAQALIGLFLGLEGHGLIERKLVRQGWTMASVVEGRDLDAVERRFFEHGGVLAEPRAFSPLPASNRPTRPLASAPVLGLFPDAQGRT
ncbi:MAG: DUF2628 domain-containing protein [Bosea sp. (in: a-proteobacteria)]